MRKVLLRALTSGGADHAAIVRSFFEREAYGDWEDYSAAVVEVWGDRHAAAIQAAMRSEFAEHRIHAPGVIEPTAFLLSIPEPDFLTAVEAGVTAVTNPLVSGGLPQRLNDLCVQRGLPYRVEGVGPWTRFIWTGDAVVSEQVIAPALSALDDPRLALGPRVEFDAARAELRAATPQARKQAVAEACNAVESAMKVLLDERQIGRPSRANAQNLFNALSGAGAVPNEAAEIVLGASRFGNRKGRHGAGPVAHDVTPGEAEAVVSSAATALTFLATRLP